MTTTTTSTGRRETPSAHLVLSIDAPRSEWLAHRRLGITATDLVAITGSKYRTAFDVWADKTMPAADDPGAGEAAFWGSRLEEPVAQAWAEKHNVKIRRVGLVANSSSPWCLASLDRLVSGCPDGRCALEVKTRSLFVADSWDKGLPDDVNIQVQWQLAVSGLDHIHVAALIGGQRMVEHIVTPDLERQAKLFEAAKIVWEAVLLKVPPTLPPELWSTEFLDQRHPERSGEVEISDRQAFDDYVKINDQIKELEDRKAELRTQLVGMLVDAEIATFNGSQLYSYKSTTTRRLDSKALASIHPDIATDDRIYNTTTTRTLRIATTKENK